MKPMAKSFKRVVLIGIGVIGLGLAVILIFAFSGKEEVHEDQQQSRVATVSDGNPVDKNLTEQQRLMIEQAQKKEAEQSSKEDKTYLGDLILGEASDVAVSEPEKEKGELVIPPPPKPKAPTSSLAREDRREQKRQEWAGNEAGMARQLALISGTLTGLPTAATVVNIQDDDSKADDDAAPGSDLVEQAEDLITVDSIHAAVTQMPVDTDISTDMRVKLVGGDFSGAVLTGKVIPLAQSGDIEDVGFTFSRMSFNGRAYDIDATALSEKTSMAALDGEVDRHLLSRYVMPVIMAGLSGASTYFTAKGTPATTVQPGTGDATLVAQQEASKQQAKEQGIGDAINKVVNTGERAVDREASRPNRVTLNAGTSIGVIFNKSVKASDQIK